MTDTAPRRRRRLALSLRGLMILVLVLAIPLAWKINHARAQRRAVEAIKRSGGVALFDFHLVDGKWNRNWQPARPAWLWRRLGSEYFGEVVEVSLYNKDALSDELIACLASLPSLDTLNICNSKFTPEQLGRLATSRSLRSLDMSLAPVGDEGLTQLRGMTGLRSLNLSFTKVTDAGLRELRGMTSLRDLNLERTSVTATGLAHLADLPALRSLNLALVDDCSQGVGGLKQLDSLTITVGMDINWFTRHHGDKTASELSSLKDLPRLKELHIDGLLDERSLAVLATFTSLERLDLSETLARDKDLTALYGLRNLRELDLRDRKVTPEGLAALQRALPSLKVIR